MTAKPRQAVWRDVVRDSALTWRGKVVGLVLSTYMNKHGHAFPSRDTIAAGGSVGVRTVDRALAELEVAGLLSVRRSKGRRANRYQAMLPATASDVRGWEWANSAPQASNRASQTVNRAPHAPESSESEIGERYSYGKTKHRISLGTPDLGYLDRGSDG